MSFLAGHLVSAEDRARMIDWMVQIMRVMKISSTRVLFLAAKLMDKYFAICQKNGIKLGRSKLHLIGMVSVYLASKFENSLTSLSMTEIVDNIGHGKFTID